MSEYQTISTPGSSPIGRRTRQVFLAGATGVIGRRLVPLLLRAGHEVTAVGRTPEKRGMLARLGARPADTDLFNPVSVRRAVEQADVIINLATAVPAGFKALWPRAWRPMDRVRREISANLTAAALAHGGIERMIQESFAPIYPDRGREWVDETTPTHPGSYNRSVLDAERNVARLAGPGSGAVCLRFAFFYGAGDPNTRQVLDSIRRGWYPLFGDPDSYSSWISEDDAAQAVLAALEVPPGTYNVVEDAPMTRRELANGLARVMGVRPPRFFPRWATRMAGPVGETLARSLRISNRKFKAASGWSPRYPDPLEGMGAVLAGEG